MCGLTHFDGWKRSEVGSNIAEAAPNKGFGRKAIAAGILLGMGLAASAAADMTYQRPTFNDLNNTWQMSANDGYFRYGLVLGADELQNFLGTGKISLANIEDPGETRNAFDFGFIESALQLPGGWTSSYEGGNNLLSLMGTVNPGESYSINFTFDPANVAFGRTDFRYHGPITSGVMPDVDTLERTQVVPLPAAGLLALWGVGAAFIGLRRTKNL